MVLDPVVRDVDPAADPDAVVALDVVEEAGQGGGAAGPNLVGVVGRKAAAAPGFAYSAALKASGWSWTAPHLDAYLANPQSALPGTLMPAAVPSPKDRADVVAFLAGPRGGAFSGAPVTMDLGWSAR